MRYLLLALLLCSCERTTVPGTPAVTQPEHPQDVAYYWHRGFDDAVPVQVVRFRSGEAFLIIGTDTHGTPIVYTHDAKGWTRTP